MFVEPFITGSYRKLNTNCGYVFSDERNTPNAFSHFSFVASGERLLICDLQGVGDVCKLRRLTSQVAEIPSSSMTSDTDPQIHSVEGIGFGEGNLGMRGIELFFNSHSCNDICRSARMF